MEGGITITISPCGSHNRLGGVWNENGEEDSLLVLLGLSLGNVLLGQAIEFLTILRLYFGLALQVGADVLHQGTLIL